MDVIGPTLAVAASWLVLGLLLAGIGTLVGHGLAGLSGDGDGLRLPTELWLGLAALLAYLQLWSVASPVTWWAWALPVAAAVPGLVLLARGWERPRPGRRAAVTFALGSLVILWLANHALAEATDYDLGLYHLGVIEYAKHYAAIPGLANLQTRFAASDPHLLLAAFVDRGPWSGAGWHLVDGLLVSLLVVELGSRLVLPAAGGTPSFTRRVACLLVPATVVVVAPSVGYRLASPNLDLACFVLVVVGMLYLAEVVERRLGGLAAVTPVAVLAAASATRPLYWLSTAAAAGTVVALAPGARRGRTLLAVGALPAALVAGWLTRQAILSGYPLYPVKLAALPVDWRVPGSVVDYTGRWTSSWARWPGQGPDTVLGSWHWLRAFWLSAQEQSLDVAAPLALTACLLPAFVSGGGGAATRRALRGPMLAVAVPSLVTLVFWFLEAPDPRFVLASLWLLPISLAAWAVPPLGRPSPLLLGAGLALGVALAAVDGQSSAWYLPAALVAPLYLMGALWVVRRPGLRPALAVVVLLGTAVGGAAAAARHSHLEPLPAGGDGPFGTGRVEVPRLVTFTTGGALRLREPASARTGNDQCFGAPVCTAALSDPALHDVLWPLRLRGRGVASGFSVGGKRSDARRG